MTNLTHYTTTAIGYLARNPLLAPTLLIITAVLLANTIPALFLADTTITVAGFKRP